MMKPLGMTVLAIWLLLVGLMGIADLNFRYDELIKGILAVAAGVLLLVKR